MTDQPNWVNAHLLKTSELVKASDYGPAEMRHMWNDVEKLEPELWRRCYPRVYESYKPNEYASPKDVARQMYGIAKKLEQGYLGASEKYEALWASQMAQYRTPTYWLTRDIVEAVMQTVPPIELDYYNMPLPFPAMAFMIPDGMLQHPIEGRTRFVGFSRHIINKIVPSIAKYGRGPTEWKSINGGMELVALAGDFFHHWNIPYSDFKLVNLAELDAMALKFDQNPHSSGWLSSPEITPEDTIFGAKVAHLIFGILLLMQARPDLTTGATLLKRVKPSKANEAAKEFWSAAVIGRTYKLRRETSQSLGGTHASPRGHWVRGFYRDQPHGPKMSLRKQMWIEPFWRGGDNE